MFYRGQLCELDFQILDHTQCRRPPKFRIRFTPLGKRQAIKSQDKKLRDKLLITEIAEQRGIKKTQALILSLL